MLLLLLLRGCFVIVNVDSIRSLLISLNAIKRTQLLTKYNTHMVYNNYSGSIVYHQSDVGMAKGAAKSL